MRYNPEGEKSLTMPADQQIFDYNILAPLKWQRRDSAAGAFVK